MDSRCGRSRKLFSRGAQDTEPGQRGLANRLIASFVAILAGWLLSSGLVGVAVAANATGAPGGQSSWTTGAKEGVGTSVTSASPVWFTLAQGVLTEVFYPHVDTPNVQDLQLVVTDGSTFVDLERDDTTHVVKLLDAHALIYQQRNTAKSGKYRITKTYFTDPDRPTLIVQMQLQILAGGPLQFYVLYNPSLNNSGLGDTGATSGQILVANDGDVASALGCNPPFLRTTNGYSATSSDGLVDLRMNRTLTSLFDTASVAGNLVQTAQLETSRGMSFTMALGFGTTRAAAATNVQTTLNGNAADQQVRYAQGWSNYLSGLKPVPNCVTANGLTSYYNTALMVLKAHGDKEHAGAHVASLCTPWGNIVSADYPGDGYHRVWSRDLYEVATALLAAGDRPAALDCLKFLVQVQQASDGSFPRYSKVDGSVPGCCEQYDEEAYPLILAWQLDRSGAGLWPKLMRTADYLASKAADPTTPQERWEEINGLSPSTLAATIAGLICAADMATANGDAVRAGKYQLVADGWRANLENWMVTTTGTFNGHRYYERIECDHNPNDNDQHVFNDGTWWLKDVVDAGFLELVRLGVKPANDATTAVSIAVVDSQIKVTTPGGDMWHRYNHDGYGENDVTGDGWRSYDIACRGRLWPLLSGERGEYELANGHADRAVALLKTMASAANDGFLIPEQCWDRADNKFGLQGKGTGSATPLCWSTAQFVRLALSIDAGKPIETPAIVTQHYHNTP